MLCDFPDLLAPSSILGTKKTNLLSIIKGVILWIPTYLGCDLGLYNRKHECFLWETSLFYSKYQALEGCESNGKSRS
jgi:hypothetical protein